MLCWLFTLYFFPDCLQLCKFRHFTWKEVSFMAVTCYFYSFSNLKMHQRSGLCTTQTLYKQIVKNRLPFSSFFGCRSSLCRPKPGLLIRFVRVAKWDQPFLWAILVITPSLVPFKSVQFPENTRLSSPFFCFLSNPDLLCF